MRTYAVKRPLLWLGLQWGLLTVCSAQGLPGSAQRTGSAEADVDSLPKYQIEVIAFAYHDFDPTEERFVEVPRGSLLDLLNPSLLETHERHEPVVSRQLLQHLRRVNENAPTLIPTEPGPDTSWLEVLEEVLSALDPLGLGGVSLEMPNLSTTEAAIDAEAAVEESTMAGVGPDEELGDAQAAPADVQGEDPLAPDEDPRWYRLLTAEEFELTSTFNRLERLDVYTPLFHGGWVQEGLAEDEAIPFDLSLLGEFNPRGTIRLHVSRFLHLTLALRFQSAQAAGDQLSPVGGGLEEISLPPRYDLHVRRLMRSGELHFFDHPAFGVIVVVRPQPEEPETLEDDLTPAA